MSKRLPAAAGALVFVFLLFILSSISPLSPPAIAQITTLETENLRLIYVQPVQSYLVPHTARCFENSWGSSGASSISSRWRR